MCNCYSIYISERFKQSNIKTVLIYVRVRTEKEPLIAFPLAQQLFIRCHVLTCEMLDQHGYIYQHRSAR